jgi:hypothetical protein
MLEAGRLGTAVLYAGASVAAGFLGVRAGVALARRPEAG